MRGAGTSARTGSSDTGSASRAALVLDAAPPPATSCVEDSHWNTVVDYYDHNATRSPNYGANWYRVLIAYRLEDPQRTLPIWEGSTAQPTARYTAAEATTSETVWFGWTPVREVLECLEAVIALPAAAAPSVSINAIAAGDEGASVTLGASLSGGTYDGALEYAWQADGGALNDPASATPVWTRPLVTSNTSHTVRLTVTARGTGTVARDNTSDTADASRSALVRDTTVTPPAASAPSVSINAIADGDEGTAVQLGATLAGGAYDGSPEYDWDVSGGALHDDASATPTWTRPTVSANTNVTVSLTVTVRGAGTSARTGSSDTGSASRAALVRDANGDHGDDFASAAPIGIPSTTSASLTSGDRDYFRLDIATAGTLTAVTTGSTDTYGTLFDGDGNQLRSNDDGGERYNFRIAAGTLEAGTYYLQVRGYWETTAGDYVLSVTGSARGPAPLPAAAAPAVTINAIAAGDENTPVTLGATLTGGTYDGTPEYAWSVTGGALTDATLAAPTWTRPTVAADANYTVRLTVTVRGGGANANAGTSATANASLDAQVRNVAAQLPAASAPSVSINAIADGDEGTAVGLSATVTGGTYDGALEYVWQVSGGTLRDQASATPTWTRPAVSSNTSYTVRLAVTARGTGTSARNATSDTRNASRAALVRNVAVQLPAAAAPSVSIDAIAAGEENTAVQLGATLTGGTYDGTVEYDWTVTGGRLSDSAAAAPTWTRPAVSTDTSYTVSLTVTARGAGTVARNATSDTARASRTAQVRDNAGDDHGDSRAAATWVSIPSTTAGELSHRDDYDYFGIEIVDPGTLTLESSGSSNPVFATLQASDGSRVRFNAYGGEGQNFRIETGVDDDALAAGVYYLWLRSFATTAYELAVSGTARGPTNALPAAAAPTVTINAVAAGDEGTSAALGATLHGGTYDGSPEYAWSATGGALDDPTLAAPTWTRPAVAADTNHTVSLTVTVHGTGTSARNGTSATANASLNTQVRNTTQQLPVASAPSVSIDAIADGDEDTAVPLGATLTGGTYDGALEYAWSVTGGALDDPASATPTWTRPAVTSNTSYTVRLTVTARGTGTNARNGTSATANASRGALVRNVAQPPAADAPAVQINAVAAGDEGTTVQLGATLTGGTYDGALEYAWSVTGGRLDDAALATPTWTRPAVTSNTSYTVRLAVTARGTGTNAASGSSDTANASRTALVRDNTTQQLPPAGAPTVTIDAIPIGTENTAVRIAATLDGGRYDALEYDWSVDGGTLNDATLATPKWTRPAVAVNTTSTVRLTLTARGTGTNARNGTSATATASRTANVHDTGADHGNNSAEATQVTIPAIASGSLDTVSDKDFFRIDVRLAGTLVLQTTGDTDTYGRLLDSNGRLLYLDDDRGSGDNFRISTASLAVGVYYLEVTGHAGALGSYNLSVMGTANDDEGAGAPLVSINTVPAGLGGATAGLSATLTGGQYDGAPEYAWTVSGGRLDDPASATPTWTRPTVSANATHTVELLLTVRGAGVNAPSGTSDSVSASRSTLVRAAGGDHGNSREHATAVSVPGTESGTLTSGDQDYFSFRLTSETSLSIWTTGTTDTFAQLLDQNGVTIAENDDSGAGDNFRMLRDLAAGDYFVRVRGYQPRGGGSAATGPYTLGLGDYPNSRPRIIASRVPGAQQLTAGGAPLLWARPTEAFTDSDDEHLWVEPSSSNEAVATAALEGASLVVYPHAAGTAIITATARDPSGSSIGASFSVEVNAPTTPTPTASFNAAGDKLTLSFTERFAAGESRAYQARVRQISPRDGIRSFCGTVTNPETTAETENVELDLSPTGFFEPGVDYEAAYRYIGASCSDTQYGRWSAVAEATTPGTASFDIDLVFVGSPTARVRTQVEAAVQTWERVIASSLQDVDFSNNPIPAGYCISGHPAVNDVVDDVRLFLKIESIDGPSGTLANAGACHIRSRSGLPVTGRIRLDEADLARLSDAQVRAIVLHEIAHTLGFARSFFYRHSLMRQPSRLIDAETVGSPDTHFAGPLARAAFDAAGGSGYQRRKVPLENGVGGSGGRDSHWREDVLDFELMTPRLDAGANPLSAITIQAMADLGYQVNTTPAQSYRLPGNFGSTRLGAQRGEVVREILGTCTVTGMPEVYDDGQEDQPQPSAARIRAVGAR